MNPTSSMVSPPATLFMAIITAIGTFIATFDRFGTAGAFCIMGLVLVLIWVADWLFRLPALTAWLPQLFNSATWPFPVVLAFGVLFLLVGATSWLFGFASIRYFRGEFTRSHDHLQISVMDYAESHFANPTEVDLRTQYGQEKAQLTRWLRWMSRGGREELESGDGKQTRQLVYLQSEPFDGDYVTVDAFVRVNAALKVYHSIAFLVHDSPGDIWYKPTWTELMASTSPNNDLASVVVTNPSKGWRLVMFLQVSPRANHEMPAKDQFVPSQRIGVHQ